MYKMLSVCLALSFGFITAEMSVNEKSSVKSNKDIEKPRIDNGVVLIEKQSIDQGNKALGEVYKNKSNLNKKRIKGDRVGKNGLKPNVSAQKDPEAAYLPTFTGAEEQNSSTVKEETLEEKIIREKFISHGNEGQRRTVRSQYLQGPRRSRLSGLQRIRESNDLFFSEYAEGSAYNKYVEIYNGTSSAIDLSGYAYAVVQNGPAAQGEADNWEEFETGATIAAGDVYVICGNQSSDSAILDACDETSTLLSNGDDGWALVKGIETDFDVLDVIGQNIFDPTYSDPGSSWAVAGVSSATKNHTLVRKPTVQEGNINWVESAGTNTDDSEWIVLDIDDFSNLGSHEVEMDDDGPYLSEGFEGDVFPPSDWDMVSFDDYGYSTTAGWAVGDASTSCWSGACGPGSPNSGDAAAYYDVYSYYYDANSMLITPSIDLSGATAPKLSFYLWDEYHSSSYGYPLEVFISTDAGATFGSPVYQAPTASFPNFVTNGWEKIDVDLSGYVGQSIHIGFKSTSDYGSDNPHLDDIVVEEPPTFPIATLSTEFAEFNNVFYGGSATVSVGLSNVGGGDLIATGVSTNPNFTVSAIPGRIAPGTTVPVDITYTPSMVAVDSGYVVLTHNGDSSPDSIKVTGSGSLNLLTEGFDSGWSGSPSAPSGWTNVVISGAGGWSAGSSFSSYDGPSSAYGAASFSNSTTSPGEHLLISPPLDLSMDYRLKFMLDGYSGTSADPAEFTHLDVQISPQNTDATTGWTTLESFTQYGDVGTPQPGSYEEQIISLAGYTGVHYLGFRLTDIYGFSIYIDNVVVEPMPAVAEISLSTDNVDFGDIFISNTVQQVVSVSNTGGADATPTIVSSNSKFTATLSSATVALGSSVDLTIVYTPTEESSDSGYVVLTHNGDSSPDSIKVTGSGSLNILTEGFDSGWSGSPPAPNGWTNVVISGAGGWSAGSSFSSYDGPSSAYGAASSLNSSTSPGEHLLVSPLLDLSGGAYRLKFMLDGYSGTSADPAEFTHLDVLASLQSTGPIADWTWDVLESFTQYGDVGTPQPGSYEQQSISLEAYPGSVYLAFRLTDVWGFSIYIDNVVVEPIPQQAVLSLASSQINMIPIAVDSTRLATIGFQNVGTGDLSGTITYSTGLTGAATFASTDNEVQVSVTPTAVGPFVGDVYFESNGGSDTVRINALVGKSVATWDDDFDGDGATDWPTGWEATQLPNASGALVGSGWGFYEDGGHTGDGYTSADAGGPGTVNDDWLISPKYQVEAGDSVSFYASHGVFANTTYPDIMTVHVSPTASTDPSLFTENLDSVANMGGSWIRYAYDLSAYVGTDVRIAIVYRGEYGYEQNVDDVVGPKVIAPTDPIIYEYPTQLDFALGGSVTKIGSSDTLKFDYLNSGGASLEVTALTFEGPFSLSSDNTLPIVTGVGGLGGFNVVFSPLADSLYYGNMVVTHNAGDPIIVSLSGVGFDGVYREDFGSYSVETGYTPLPGWTYNDDGVVGTEADFTNATNGLWGRASISGNGMMYHSYNPGADADTVISPVFELPALDPGYHYELDTDEYLLYGYASYNMAYCGLAISIDGGLTFSAIGQVNYSENGTHSNNYDLTGYSGTNVHLAMIYNGTNGVNWGVSTLAIRKKADPVVPIFNHTSLVFPVTALNESVSRKVYYQNSGVGTFSGDITYPASMSGPASIAGLVPGVIDSMVVTYTPSTPGIETGDITIDGTASNGGMVNLGVEANAGELAFDLETKSAGWQQYSLGGQPWVAPSGAVYSDTWTWFGGTGHSGPNYYGVYSFGPYWGGVDDYLVSPRYSLSDASEVISFYASGGDDTERDSLNVWVSTERPQMGFTVDADGMRADTGFVNTSAFTMVHESLPTNLGWDPVNVVLPTDQSDVWVMIHSVQHYKEDGSMDGWMLKVDDLGTPKIYENPLPVLRVGTRYDFGVTTPDGDSVKYFIRNTGSVDLVIDSMNFDDGMYFDVEYADAYPITIVPGGVDSIQVFWMPEMEGRQTDTLRYFSNYTVGQFDAFGFGTDHSVFTADAFNAPPGAVMLLTPDPTSTPLVTIDANNATGSTDFFWTNTTDPDGTPIDYIFEMWVAGGDTMDTLLSSNSFSLDHALVVEMMTELSVTSFEATWDVYADDGFEATGSSNGPWALSFDAGWVLGGLDNNTIPDVFALHNNYPNPFNPVTNIKYDIPVASDVRIDIYNIAGEKVRTLVSREHQPGRYKIQWNATNEFGSPVATGMYIYKIHAKDFVSVKKLLLMK